MERFIIDRFEGELAVLEGENKALSRVESCLLPPGARQGDVLLYLPGEGYRLDEAAGAARRKAMQDMLNRLVNKKRPPE